MARKRVAVLFDYPARPTLIVCRHVRFVNCQSDWIFRRGELTGVVYRHALVPERTVRWLNSDVEQQGECMGSYVIRCNWMTGRVSQIWIVLCLKECFREA